MRALVLAAVATAVSLAAPAANATVVTFSPLASIGSHYLPGGPYQENGLQFLSLGGPLINGTVPCVPSGSTNATLLFDGPLVITAAGGDPYYGSKPFKLISLDIDNYASTFGVGIRFEYLDSTGYHFTAPQGLDNLPGLETIALNLTDVRWFRLFPAYGPYYGFQIDNVSYTLPAAPEPATWALLLLGFAGVSFVAYRRKSNMTLRIAQMPILERLQGNQMRKLALAAALSMTAVIGESHAAILTWNFTAKVTEDFNSTLNVNDTVSGSFSFDTATAPSYYQGDYSTYYNSALTAVLLNGFSIAPLTYSRIAIRNDYISLSCHFLCSASDSFSVTSQMATPFLSSPQVNQQFNLYLSVSSGYGSQGDLGQIVNEQLPSGVYNLSAFPIRQIYFSQSTPGTSFNFRADLTSLTLASPVPEASTWSMLLLGFACLVLTAHRRNSLRRGAPQTAF